jgi:uncharacterized membrane protein YphA (DoxX/SURF4 family)
MVEAIVLLLARLTLGFFFVGYRFRWLYDPSPNNGVKWCNPYRHDNLKKKLCECGWGIKGLAELVAIVELLAGLGLIFGLLTSLSALGLLVILLAATACTAREKVLRQNPVDRLDAVNCYLWTPEPVYMVLAVVVLGLGPGWISIDAHWSTLWDFLAGVSGRLLSSWQYAVYIYTLP